MTQPDDTRMAAEVWNREDSTGQTMLYTLRQDGWRRGGPVMVNDTTVVIAGRDREAVVERVLSALAASPPLAEGGREAWGQYARAICESEGRDWMALDNSRADCERWIKAGQACLALSLQGN